MPAQAVIAPSDAEVIGEWEADAHNGLCARLQVDRAPPRRLTPEQVAQFDRDGFLLPLDGISAAEAAATRSRIEAMEAAEQQGGNGLFSNAHCLYGWWQKMATRPELLDVVEDLLGPNIMIWKSQLWIKEAGSDSFVGWHQDARYWGLTPIDSVNVWMALTDVTPENGPMQYLRGSHSRCYPTIDTYSADSLLTRGQDIDFSPEAGPDPDTLVSAVLKPGKFSIHHLGVAHGGGPNRGDDRRIGFNVTYVVPRVRSVRPDGAFAQLVRGVDDCAHFNRDRVPTADNPTSEEREAFLRKAAGLSRTVLTGADVERFLAVAEERRSKNVAPHVGRDSSGYADHLTTSEPGSSKL